DRTLLIQVPVRRSTGVTLASDTSISDSTVNAVATPANSHKKSCPAWRITAAAVKPAAAAAITLIEVQVAHLRIGCATSRRGRSASSPAAPTRTPASGPNSTAANTQTSEATETSALGVRLMLS